MPPTVTGVAGGRVCDSIKLKALCVAMAGKWNQPR